MKETDKPLPINHMFESKIQKISTKQNTWIFIIWIVYVNHYEKAKISLMYTVCLNQIHWKINDFQGNHWTLSPAF